MDDLDDLERKLDGAEERIRKRFLTKSYLLVNIELAKQAKNLVPTVTGTLKNSIDENGFVKEEGDMIVMGISTNLKYAPCVEYGTGYKGDPGVPHTPKKYWRYQSEDDGKWHTEHPRESRPYMRPALQIKKEVAKKILAREAKEAIFND